MKVLAFAASNSRQSINQQLVKYAASKIENAEIEVLDLNDFEMPIYSSDRESESGIPDQAQRFYDKIGAADVILISFAEHNGSYTAAYKNIFDWTSRIDMKVYQNTPMLLMATSPGPGGAQSVLGAAVNSAPYFAADVKASLSVPSFFDNFDVEAAKLTNDEIEASLESALKQLAN
ncbi:NADPH-dependent FMN reductase [Pseudoalteromonas luteoviolacea S2607]|uniref:NADPH-dependent FMN reductase n=1 Tax=Pseudoalteromonas luteoviolacea TaxID=43657 RepID=UPI0007B04E86|nr:NAD(P)H-dependent oxidoreductase [Pseudoalteromonas luteoviolacea]KZN34229.1 NADPH-dependent FMN reductase [Pseudoalteromonas luteoviolacea S2607]